MSKVNIPCMVTLLNLCCGLTAMVLHFKGMDILALTALVGAVLFDWLDGTLARKLNQQSDLGERLDSLADIVSFIVAPIMLCVGPSFSWLLLPALFVFGAGGAIRLADYDPRVQSHAFHGLPSPTAGLLLVTSMLAFGSVSWFALIPIFLGCLMVSNKLQFAKAKLNGKMGLALGFMALFGGTLAFIHFVAGTLGPTRDFSVSLLVPAFTYLIVNVVASLVRRPETPVTK